MQQEEQSFSEKSKTARQMAAGTNVGKKEMSALRTKKLVLAENSSQVFYGNCKVAEFHIK